MKIEYNDLMNVIIDGVTKHNENEIIGKLFTQGKLNRYDLLNKEILEEAIRFNSQQTAHTVIVELKKYFGSELKILEEGRVVLNEYDNKERSVTYELNRND